LITVFYSLGLVEYADASQGVEWRMETNSPTDYFPPKQGARDEDIMDTFFEFSREPIILFVCGIEPRVEARLYLFIHECGECALKCENSAPSRRKTL